MEGKLGKIGKVLKNNQDLEKEWMKVFKNDEASIAQHHPYFFVAALLAWKPSP